MRLLAAIAALVVAFVQLHCEARAQDVGAPPKTLGANTSESLQTQDWPIVEARLVSTGAVEVGQPFEVEVICRHSADFEVEAAAQVEEALSLDERWLVLGLRAVPDVPAPGEPSPRFGFAPGATLVSRVVYTLASLGLEAFDGESGLDWREERTLTGLGLDIVRGDTRRFVPAAPLELRVTSLLVPTDRAPRPLPGPLAVTDDGEPASTRYVPWIAGGGVLALAAGLLVLRRRRARVPSAPLPPTRRESLLGLRDALASGQAPLRDSVFTLAASVRASCAERGVVNVLSDTDEEWRARVDPTLFARGELERLDRFLRLAENARFAPATPTRWAVLDLAGEAVAIDDETLLRSAEGKRPADARAVKQPAAAARGEVES